MDTSFAIISMRFFCVTNRKPCATSVKQTAKHTGFRLATRGGILRFIGEVGLWSSLPVSFFTDVAFFEFWPLMVCEGTTSDGPARPLNSLHSRFHTLGHIAITTRTYDICPMGSRYMAIFLYANKPGQSMGWRKQLDKRKMYWKVIYEV